MEKKLTRSATDKKICGVCGGLGEYLDLDPTIIRIVFVFLALMCGGGLIAYLLMALIMPVKKEG